MAGCYGNSAEDRYWEARLDEYLDSLTSIEDVYGDKAAEIIEKEINELDDMFCEYVDDGISVQDGERMEMPEDYSSEAWKRWYKEQDEAWRKMQEDAYYEYRKDPVMQKLADKDSGCEEPDYDDYRERML